VNYSDIDLSSFVFRSILRGLWWSATGILIAIWVIITAFFLTGLGEFAGYDFSSVEKLSFFQSIGNILGEIASSIVSTLALTVVGFFILGIPITILPSIVGSTILSIWLYHDGKINKLSGKKSQWKGAAIGLLAGFAALFTPYTYFGWPGIWLWFAVENKYQILFWIIIIVVPVAGAFTGRLFAKSLAKELEPVGDYFSIDWEALQKEQQDTDVTPDTSTHDT
jgi:hypothetical protein